MDRVVIVLGAAAALCAVTAGVIPVDAALEPSDIFVNRAPGELRDIDGAVDVEVDDRRIFVEPPATFRVVGWGSGSDGANVTLVSADSTQVVTVTIANGRLPSGETVHERDGRPVVLAGTGRVAWALDAATLITVASMSGETDTDVLLRVLDEIRIEDR